MPLFQMEKNYRDLYCVSILCSALTLKAAAQRDFVESNSARMVGHLLSHLVDRHLTVSLYHEFVTLFDMVSYKPLKRDLFKYILVNYDVWIHAHADVQRQIVRHWSRTLLVEHSNLWKECRPINNILDALRIYYYYAPIENELICRERGKRLVVIEPKDPPVKDIRQHILHTLATPDLRTDSFRSLLGHLISCKDLLQVHDLLSFFLESSSSKSRYSISWS
jgi:hypothetical protein